MASMVTFFSGQVDAVAFVTELSGDMDIGNADAGVSAREPGFGEGFPMGFDTGRHGAR
jgi:hypothetical protein